MANLYTPQQLGIKPPSGGFQTGGWYNGRQYWNGTLSDVNVIHPQSDQQGAGAAVSAEVVAASNPTQNKAPGTNEAYLAKEANKPVPAPAGGSVIPQNFNANFVGLGATPAGSGTGIGVSQPTIDLQKVYDSSFKTPEIDNANKAIADVQAEIDKNTKAFDEQMAVINDNPLYGAGTMTGKAAKLKDKYNADIQRLQNKQALAADNLAKLKADAEVKVNIATKQYDINNQAYKDQLNLFTSLLEKGALTGASGSDIASYAIATGIPASMISNIVEKQKKDEIKPTVINSTDDNGNVTVAIIDQMTGTVLSKTNLGKIDKSKSSTTTATKQQYFDMAKQDARSGATLQQMMQIYGGYLSPNEVYALYNANSKFGPAKESPDVLKQYGVNPNINQSDILSTMLGLGGQ